MSEREHVIIISVADFVLYIDPTQPDDIETDLRVPEPCRSSGSRWPALTEWSCGVYWKLQCVVFRNRYTAIAYLHDFTDGPCEMLNSRILPGYNIGSADYNVIAEVAQALQTLTDHWGERDHLGDKLSNRSSE